MRVCSPFALLFPADCRWFAVSLFGLTFGQITHGLQAISRYSLTANKSIESIGGSKVRSLLFLCALLTHVVQDCRAVRNKLNSLLDDLKKSLSSVDEHLKRLERRVANKAVKYVLRCLCMDCL
jgi:hypothetical protein